jgi:hypothetical protein
MIDEVTIAKKLKELLSRESGLFGHQRTWGMKKEPYEFIGYELSEEFVPTLELMTDIQRKNLFSIMSYFEIHAKPLKEILLAVQSKGKNFEIIFHETAWSHFMIIVMFGILEVAVKISPLAHRYENGYLKKKKSIQDFLLAYIPITKQEDVVRRYYIEATLSSKKSVSSFSELIDHLWFEVRGEFVHDAGLQSKGLDWTAFGGGNGTKDDPIMVHTDVPVAELLQITWQAILKSYGYKGLLIPQFIKVK